MTYVRLLSVFVWLAENLGTFFGVWRYPNQIGAWARVSLGKWSSWSLLVIMTFTLVANLKVRLKPLYLGVKTTAGSGEGCGNSASNALEAPDMMEARTGATA